MLTLTEAVWVQRPREVLEPSSPVIDVKVKFVEGLVQSGERITRLVAWDHVRTTPRKFGPVTMVQPILIYLVESCAHSYSN